jgi:hypothetical protein
MRLLTAEGIRIVDWRFGIHSECPPQTPEILYYSVRKTCMGSILAARRAGSTHAASATPMSTIEDNPSVNGSSAEIP